MHKIIFTSTLLIIHQYALCVVDTLSYYDNSTANLGYYYPSATYNTQYACFKLPAPGFINAVIIKLYSTASATATLHIYGHEGGTSFPQLKNNLITPVTVNKTGGGVKKVTVALPTPLWVDNNQFFIQLTDFSSGLQLITDTITHTPFCSSPSGGDYFLQYIEDGTNLYYGPNAFAIDAIIDFAEGLSSPLYLQNVTAAAGIDTNISNDNVSWGDINNDWKLDLLVAGKLFKNIGNGAFSDITAQAGITTPAYISTFIDMNNDGKEDILFLNTDNQYNKIYINNGNETFTQSALNFSVPPSFVAIRSFSITDFNNDKYPDLFVGQLWDPYPTPQPNYLFLNDQNLGFTDVSTLLYPANGSLDRQTRGSMFMDFDNDGDMDLYVSNYYLQPDELWQNNGNGTFTNIIASKNIDYDSQGGSGHGTGCDWADYDNDGDMDLLLPSLAHPQWILQYDHRPTTIYQNTGAPDYNFSDLKGQNGVQYEETHAGGTWGDINNDGLMDFAICAFYGCRYTDIYLQKPDNNFELKSFSFGVNDVVAPSDLAMIDFNNDGKLDLACGDKEGVFSIFKNDYPLLGNYVEIDLVCTSGNSLGIGARVEVFAGGKQYTQYQMPYHGSLMSKGKKIHFGLGAAATVDSVIVSWPNGIFNREKFTGVLINNYNILTEGGNVTIGSVSEITAVVSSFNVYPVPAHSNIIFNYELTEPAIVTIDVYNFLGQKISLISDEYQIAGIQSIHFNLKDASGKTLSPGVYSWCLKANKFIRAGLLLIE